MFKMNSEIFSVFFVFFDVEKKKKKKNPCTFVLSVVVFYENSRKFSIN